MGRCGRAVIRLARALLADRRGAAGVLVACALPMLLAASALAVDLGYALLEARQLQGAADAAALAAAIDPASAEVRARADAVVAASRWDAPVVVTVEPGRYRATLSPAKRFQPAADAPDAVRVTLSTEAPTFLARVWGRRGVAMTRTAVAARQRMAAFSVGGRLAALDGGALNGLLSALAGTQVSLSLVDYEGLAGADLDAAHVAGLLRARLGSTGGTYAEVLGTPVPAGEVLAVMADAADGSVRAALQALARQLGSGPQLKLGDLVDLGAYARQTAGGEGLVSLNALSAVSAVLRGGPGARQVSFRAGLTDVTLALAGGTEQSPWISLSEPDGPVIRTSQARLYARTTLDPLPIPGVASLVSLEVPLFVEAARAEARLADVACPAPDRRAVGIDARAGPAFAALASVDPDALRDFTRPVTLNEARLLRAPLLEVGARAVIDAGGAEPWQRLTFDEADIRARTPRTVNGAHPLTGAAQTLARDAVLTTRVAGLTVPATAATRAVASQLALAAPALDALLALATGASGVRLGQADVRVTGVRCGTAALVG